MHWIALLPPDDARTVWTWRALQFTPRVAQVDEALVMEVSGVLRLWGGRDRLLRRFFRSKVPVVHTGWSQGATSLIATALLRLSVRAQAPPGRMPQDLPLSTLSAAAPHLDTLARIGCRTWGDLRALPRGGAARRFGAPLLAALDAAFGEQPENHAWLTLPEVFDLRVELPALAVNATELMWAAQRLLGALREWLQARQRGVLAIELEWTHDLRRLDGQVLPPQGKLVLRTGQPVQGIAHLKRLLAEHLARSVLAAPVNHLRLRTLDTAPWAGVPTSLLPEDQVRGDRLHELVERLGARLGPHNVCVPQPLADHRPERMQRWVPAQGVQPQPSSPQGGLPTSPPKAVHGTLPKSPMAAARAAGALPADALYPTWLLPEPLRLAVHHHVPQHGGPLRRLTRLYRVEAGWWEGGGPALRDYYIAHSAHFGLVWIYRERPASLAQGLEQQDEFRWYLQGLYA